MLRFFQNLFAVSVLLFSNVIEIVNFLIVFTNHMLLLFVHLLNDLLLFLLPPLLPSSVLSLQFLQFLLVSLLLQLNLLQDTGLADLGFGVLVFFVSQNLVFELVDFRLLSG